MTERNATHLDLDGVRWRLIAEHALDPADVDLLSGIDEPTLRKQARRLVERSAAAKQQPRPNLMPTQGRNGDAELAGFVNDLFT